MYARWSRCDLHATRPQEVATIVYCPNWEIILESFLESGSIEAVQRPRAFLDNAKVCDLGQDFRVLDRNNQEFTVKDTVDREPRWQSRWHMRR